MARVVSRRVRLIHWPDPRSRSLASPRAATPAPRRARCRALPRHIFSRARNAVIGGRVVGESAVGSSSTRYGGGQMRADRRGAPRKCARSRLDEPRIGEVFQRARKQHIRTRTTPFHYLLHPLSTTLRCRHAVVASQRRLSQGPCPIFHASDATLVGVDGLAVAGL